MRVTTSCCGDWEMPIRKVKRQPAAVARMSIIRRPYRSAMEPQMGAAIIIAMALPLLKMAR